MTTNYSVKTNTDTEKVLAERINGYAALFGCIALIGAYVKTGQIIPGFVWGKTTIGKQLKLWMVVSQWWALSQLLSITVSPAGLFQDLFNLFFITMALSYWLRAEVDDLLNEDTFFDSSDYSSLLEDTDWA